VSGQWQLDGSLIWHVPLALQNAGFMHFGPVLSLHVAPSAAAASHVPVVEPTLDATQVPLAVHAVSPVANVPQDAPAVVLLYSVQRLLPVVSQ
jgi:hypothetical protein